MVCPRIPGDGDLNRPALSFAFANGRVRLGVLAPRRGDPHRGLDRGRLPPEPEGPARAARGPTGRSLHHVEDEAGPRLPRPPLEAHALLEDLRGLLPRARRPDDGRHDPTPRLGGEPRPEPPGPADPAAPGS